MKSILLTIFSLIMISSLANASTLSVGSGKQYSTIQAAINASSNGDIITVYAGTYTDSHTYTYSSHWYGNTIIAELIEKNNITIQANPGDTPILNGQGSAHQGIVIYSGSGNTIKGLKFINFVTQNAPFQQDWVAGGVSIYASANTIIDGIIFDQTINTGQRAAVASAYPAGPITLKNSYIRNGGRGVDFSDGTVTIEGNTVDLIGTGDYGIIIVRCNSSTVRYNYVAGSTGFGIRERDSRNVSISHNVLYKNTGRAINLQDQPDSIESDEYNTVTNNTVDGGSVCIFINGQQYPTIQNNVCVNTSKYIDLAWGNTTSMVNSSNLTYNVSTLSSSDGSSGWVDSGGNFWNVDPMFNASGNIPFPYFSLKPDSPIINRNIGASQYSGNPINPPITKPPSPPSNLTIN